MRRVFRTRNFTCWMRKAGLTDDVLCEAVSEMAQGFVDADLGGQVVKKRVAFGKNERANIDKDELKVFQRGGEGVTGVQ